MSDPNTFTPTWSIEAKKWKDLNPEHTDIPDQCPECGEPFAPIQAIDATIYREVWFRSDGTIRYGDAEPAYDEPYAGSYMCAICDEEMGYETCKAIDAALKAAGVMPSVTAIGGQGR